MVARTQIEQPTRTQKEAHHTKILGTIPITARRYKPPARHGPIDWRHFAWSYSKLSTYADCPRAFYYQYIVRAPEEPNNFAAYGTLMHSLLERYAKNELASFELLDRFYDEYELPVDWPPFPPGLEERYIAAADKFLSAFDGYGDDREIVAVEKRVETQLLGRKFHGVIDLVLKNADGGFTVVDHKSKSADAARGKKLKEALRQQYIYAALLFRPGSHPNTLAFNLFRANKWVEAPYSEEDSAEALNLALEIMERAESDGAFRAKKGSDYFCHYICGSRMTNHCPNGQP